MPNVPVTLPPPHRAVIRVDDVARVPEPAFGQHARRCIGRRQRMGADLLHQPTAEGEGDECLSDFGGIATPFEGGDDAVRHLDDAGRIRRSLEPCAANDGATVPMQHREPEPPRIGIPEGAQARQKCGRDFG